MYGDSFQNCLVAIIVPDEEPVRHWATTNAPALAPAQISFGEICESQVLKTAIMADIQRLSRDHGLQGFEMIKDIYLESEHFTAANDLATPTFKLKRNTLRDRYQSQIDAMYNGLLAGLHSKL